jgi:hypothetical protein
MMLGRESVAAAAEGPAAVDDQIDWPAGAEADAATAPADAPLDAPR